MGRKPQKINPPGSFFIKRQLLGLVRFFFVHGTRTVSSFYSTEATLGVSRWIALNLRCYWWSLWCCSLWSQWSFIWSPLLEENKKTHKGCGTGDLIVTSFNRGSKGHLNSSCQKRALPRRIARGGPFLVDPHPPFLVKFKVTWPKRLEDPPHFGIAKSCFFIFVIFLTSVVTRKLPQNHTSTGCCWISTFQNTTEESSHGAGTQMTISNGVVKYDLVGSWRKPKEQ